jgi:hypothetical protein
LQDNHFKVLKLKTMLEHLKGNNLPDKCVVLTADDAYHSIAENAYPYNCVCASCSDLAHNIMSSAQVGQPT